MTQTHSSDVSIDYCEAVVIGACMIDPRMIDSLSRVLAGHMFSRSFAGATFDALVEMRRNGIDPVLHGFAHLRDALHRRGIAHRRMVTQTATVWDWLIHCATHCTRAACRDMAHVYADRIAEEPENRS